MGVNNMLNYKFLNKRKIFKNDISIFLFYISYILIVMNSFFERIIFLKKYLIYFNYVSIILLFVCFLMQSKKYKKKTLLNIFFLLVIACSSYFISKNTNILLLILLLICSFNISFEKFIKNDLIIKLILILIVVSSHFLGLTDEFISYREHFARQSFGFSHANTFGFVISMLVIEFLYIKRKYIKWYHIFPIILIVYFIQHFSDSRGSIILLIMVFLACLLKKIKMMNIIYNPIIKKIISNSFVIFTLLSFIMVYLYSSNNYFGVQLDNLFTTRISSMYNFLKLYDINLMGNKLLIITTETARNNHIQSMILDNAFVHIILNYGLVIFCIFSVWMKKTFDFAYKQKNDAIIIILFLLVIYGLMETYLFKIPYNAFLIFFGQFIYYKEEKNNEQS